MSRLCSRKPRGVIADQKRATFSLCSCAIPGSQKRKNLARSQSPNNHTFLTLTSNIPALFATQGFRFSLPASLYMFVLFYPHISPLLPRSRPLHSHPRPDEAWGLCDENGNLGPQLSTGAKPKLTHQPAANQQ